MITTLVANLLLLAPCAQGTEPVSLRFGVPAQTSIQKNLLIRHQIQLDGVTYARKGRAGRKIPTNGWMSTWFKVTCNDTYVEVADGLPRRILRTYGDMGGGGDMSMKLPTGPKTEDSAVLTSPLHKRTVDFTWIDEEKDWARKWVRDDAEEFWLAEMRGDMDALGLLPEGEVVPGQEWELPIEVVRSLLAPGGNHLITPRTTNVFGRTIEVGVGGDFAEVLGEDLTGRLLARFSGIREVDGRRLGVIDLTVQSLRSVADRTDLWRLSAPREEKEEPAKLLYALVEYTLDARGEAVWDLDAGHLQALLLEGPEVYVLSVNKSGGPAEEPWERLQQSNFKGTLKLTYTLGAPPEGFDGDASDGHGQDK